MSSGEEAFFSCLASGMRYFYIFLRWSSKLREESRFYWIYWSNSLAGYPRPTVTWYYGYSPLPSTNSRSVLLEGGRTLKITRVQVRDFHRQFDGGEDSPWIVRFLLLLDLSERIKDGAKFPYWQRGSKFTAPEVERESDLEKPLLFVYFRAQTQQPGNIDVKQETSREPTQPASASS